jgi:aminoglycoside/choline kinase family phosphotransferase
MRKENHLSLSFNDDLIAVDQKTLQEWYAQRDGRILLKEEKKNLKNLQTQLKTTC